MTNTISQGRAEHIQAQCQSMVSLIAICSNFCSDPMLDPNNTADIFKIQAVVSTFQYCIPILDYCSTSWGTCGNTDLEIVIRLHKKKKNSCKIHFRCWLIMNKDHMIFLIHWIRTALSWGFKRKWLILLYKSLNGLAPTNMEEMFKFDGNLHSNSLRWTSRSTVCYIYCGANLVTTNGFHI